MSVVTLPAYAKLNLELDIVGTRADGYHDIVTEMQEISLCDTVTVRLSESLGIRVTCDNPAIPVDNRNIAYRAAEAFFAASECSFGAEIQIQKQIPLMAGLGGSSTNGAAVLKALNGLQGGIFSRDELIAIGAKLGADVPFALVGGRAKCEGIGEIITVLPALPPQFYVIVQPDFFCETRAAYKLYDSGVTRGHYANIFQKLYNDSRIDGICAELVQLGALSASMTGSGSAVFGVFADENTACQALERLQYSFKCIARNNR
jgi:4-diphosphocytidyl-2-C-methyl-D-erythritol kinase